MCVCVSVCVVTADQTGSSGSIFSLEEVGLSLHEHADAHLHAPPHLSGVTSEAGVGEIAQTHAHLRGEWLPATGKFAREEVELHCVREPLV